MAGSYSAGSLEVSLLTTANEVSKVFSALNLELRTTKKLVDGITGRTSKVSKATGQKKNASESGGAFGFLKVAKWGAVIHVARRLGRVVSNIAQAGADYTETLNLWETAMGNNVTMATEFVSKMNEAYGISEKTLMNAQATFKNMLGGLGNISDEMAYALSEGITQMAVDYASLYNQTFEQAFTKFEAALAGQVRPIRSVSGYDITENTLFQLYQSLGGEKTMRQLTRTEKQLLSILAIFQQMDRTGALGDLNKTMNSYANQSRVMAESWEQVKTYAGALLTYTIQESRLLVNINAILIFIGDVLKTVAENLGAIQHFDDVFGSVTNSALDAANATEELNGKLLDFDKFRALNESSDTNAFGFDERLAEAFKNFDTILGNASMEARELANSFKVMSGLFDENGAFNVQRWEGIVDNIEAFGLLVASIVAKKTLIMFAKGIMSIKLASASLSNVLLTGVVYAILTAIDAFKEGDYVTSSLSITIGVTLVGAILLLKGAIIDGKFYLDLFGKTVSGTMVSITMGVAMLGGGIIALISNWDKLGTSAKILIPTLSVLLGLFTSYIVATKLLKGNWIGALSVGAMVTGAGLMVSSQFASMKDYAEGGLPDKGTVFRAGEAGAEIVYNTPSGQSGVANIKQIEQAMYGAMVRYGKSQNNQAEERIVIQVGEDEIFNATRKSAKRHGFDYSRI